MTRLTVRELEPWDFWRIEPRDEQREEVTAFITRGEEAWARGVAQSETKFAFIWDGRVICLGGLVDIDGQQCGWAIIAKGASWRGLMAVLRFTKNYLKPFADWSVRASSRLGFEQAETTLAHLGFRPDYDEPYQAGYVTWFYRGLS
jgi:hypothetical protein